MANVSINQFAQRIQKNKGTVSRDCKNLGIDASNGLDEMAVYTLLDHYGLVQTTAEVEGGELQVIQPGDQLDNGPILPTSIDLSQWSIQPIQGMADPLQVARQTSEIVDLIIAGLNEHVDSLKTREANTTKAANTLTQKQRELELAATKAELRSELSQDRIKQSEAAISDIVQSLGK